MRPPRVAVVGVGSVGHQHARVWAELPEVALVGVYDIEASRGAEVARRHSCLSFSSLEELLAASDAVSVAVPTLSHHQVTRRVLEAGKDVLLEKPMTSTLSEADELIRLASEKGKILQVGHIERFNPAVDVLKEAARQPRFIEVHRLGSFSSRSLDIDVVLDLMIHDLDIVLSLEGSEVVQVDAVGVPILTPKVDIANARLRFRSGLIVNLTASRVSTEKVRKFRVFCPRTYISVDFAAQTAQVFRLVEGAQGPDIRVEQTRTPEDEPLRRQLVSFARAVRDRSEPVVSGSDGRRALALALLILDRMAEEGVPPPGLNDTPSGIVQ